MLPVFWHVASKRWVDWKEITPIPDGAHDIRQIWNANCFNCHGTNIVQGYDLDEKKYKSTWTEMGIGCEACHGPGRQHVALMEEWEKDPASKPAYDNSSKNRQLSDTLKIFSTRSSEPRRIYDTCAYCHGNKNNVFVGFKGGDHYADYALPFLISEPIPENDLQGEFWPDGRPNRFNRPQALTLSGCFKAGAITCTNCHVAHGSRNEYLAEGEHQPGPQRRRAVHAVPHGAEAASTAGPARSLKPSSASSPKPSFTGAGLQAHTFHAPESAGSRCISCHMSDVNWRLLIRRRDHTFQPPVPENTAQFGIPNACTTCHDNRSPEWAAKQMDAVVGRSAIAATRRRRLPTRCIAPVRATPRRCRRWRGSRSIARRACSCAPARRNYIARLVAEAARRRARAAQLDADARRRLAAVRRRFNVRSNERANARPNAPPPACHSRRSSTR